MGLLRNSCLSYVVYTFADVVHDEVSISWFHLAVCIYDQWVYCGDRMVY